MTAFGMPVAELAMLAAAILAGGAVSGFLAGLFGVGGGAVTVPVLYEIFRVMGVSDDVRMQLCVGTSLAIILPTAYRSFMAHKSHGALPTGILWAWALPIVGGVAFGGAIAMAAPAWVFKLAFVILSWLIAARMFFGRESWRLGETLPGRALMSLYGLIVGFYASVMGVGGGSVAMLFLMLYGTAIHVAIALAAGVGIIISMAGTVSYMIAGLPQQALMPPLSIGFVSLIGVVLMAPTASFVAPYGAHLAHRLTRRQLEISLGMFMVLVSLRFLASLVL